MHGSTQLSKLEFSNNWNGPQIASEPSKETCLKMINEILMLKVTICSSKCSGYIIIRPKTNMFLKKIRLVITSLSVKIKQKLCKPKSQRRLVVFSKFIQMHIKC